MLWVCGALFWDSFSALSSWRDEVGILDYIVLVQDCVGHWMKFSALVPPSASQANNCCKAHHSLCQSKPLPLPDAPKWSVTLNRKALLQHLSTNLSSKVQHIKALSWRPELHITSFPKTLGFHLEPIPSSVSPHSTHKQGQHIALWMPLRAASCVSSTGFWTF